MKVLKVLTNIAIILNLILPRLTLAQSVSVTLNQSPQNPSPGERISFSVAAFEFNVDLAKITWTVDGKAQNSGTGLKNFFANAPENGKSMNVGVEVVPQNGSAINRSVLVSPASIDIVWEALDSYTPPFYKGKSLPISQSQIKVSAIPVIKNGNTTLRNPGDFAYTWRKDGTNFPGQSGLGKSSFSFSHQTLDKNNKIEVSVTDGTRTASNVLTIAPYSPEIIFYEVDRNTGLPKYQEAFGNNKNIKQSRVSVIAEPFFLSKDYLKNTTIKTLWQLNGQQVNSPIKNNLVIDATNTLGNISVSFSYDDTKRLFRDSSFSTNLNVSN
ncbi:MAG: hypothetical protein IT284_00320 [Bacteroidetes bacterium]|nr:hypothetical protein [Bacteroidota bacterium]